MHPIEHKKPSRTNRGLCVTQFCISCCVGDLAWTAYMRWSRLIHSAYMRWERAVVRLCRCGRGPMQCAKLSCTCWNAYAGHTNGPISLIHNFSAKSTDQTPASCISPSLVDSCFDGGKGRMEQIIEVFEILFIVHPSLLGPGMRPQNGALS